MCYLFKITKTAEQLEQNFNAVFKASEDFRPTVFNGFDFKQTPVITNIAPKTIDMFHWGLLPEWAKDKTFRKNTLNAKIESIKEKPSFRSVVDNRCIILIDGFFEWQWLDENGKQKQKYEMTLPNDEVFSLAGLYNVWKDIKTGETLKTYTILTTAANEQMAVIHNSKKRMPVILPAGYETQWLQNGHLPKESMKLKTKKIGLIKNKSETTQIKLLF
jgi:putative SOS response-associated peptidase YedK